MEWKIELLEEEGLLRVVTRGPFELRQQREMFEELGAHPALSNRLPILFDNRQLDMSGTDLNVIRQSVQVVQDFMRKHHVERLAGLVNQGFSFGVGRQFEILTDSAGGHGFRLFSDEQPALRWLGGELRQR